MIVPPDRRCHLEGLCFVTLWTTGPDPAFDGILRVQALRGRSDPSAGDENALERFDRTCNPFAETDAESISPAVWRAAEALGLSRERIEASAAVADVWDELRSFVGAGPIVAPDAESFATWFRHLSGTRTAMPPCIGLSEMAGLFVPGRLALRRAELVTLLGATSNAGDGAGTSARHAADPESLRAALIELVRRIHALDEDVLRLAALGYTRTWRALAGTDDRAAARLQLALALLDRPSALVRSALAGRVRVGSSSDDLAGGDAVVSEFERERPALRDGRIVALARGERSLEELLEDLQPRCAREQERQGDVETLPPDTVAPDKRFDPRDMITLDEVFREHLPKSFTRAGAATLHRPSQHEVARAVAKSLGSGELLLVHAPTGTGKTLAYLVPAMLWARRHGVRVGIATYTRALQEQAMDREVPRALAMLARAGVPDGTRTSVLKGRENYVCWRAVKLSVPEEETAEAWLAWTTLALFAATDTESDLDRLPLRSALPLESSEPFVRALQTLLRGVRCQTACCTRVEDRQTCGAEVARKRAEKCHVVIINQAFALARQEFFRHMVFDECEHLHDQAHSAWSATIGFRDIRGVMARLHQPGRPRSRAVLDRVERMLILGTPSGDACSKALEAWSAFDAAIDALETCVRAFDAWREEERKTRVDREQHSLLREYVEAETSREIVDARIAASHAGNQLDAALAELIERIDQLPVHNAGPLRRAFDTTRSDLLGVLEVLEAWIPVDEGRPRFRPRTFYDVEVEPRGDTILAARVLLPHEFLGRNYYPELKTGVFLSATTWLQDGFAASRAYLGLDRAEHPAPDEERAPSTVTTFRAPDVFDYRRVLIAVPRDAPPVSADKDKFLDYVRRFVTYLGERTRGRMLVLFTNSADARRMGEETAGFFRARRIPLWFQNMEGAAKEELSELFRSTVDSVLFGVDTFWYGADFPGETLEYLVIVRLPYGVPDRYHHAQCAAIGMAEQRRQIYLPRALAKFRQGFGRLMRRESDRGCVFVLDGRITDPRHRMFLRELPIARSFEAGTAFAAETTGARLVRGDTDHCLHEALAHMNLLGDLARRGLDWSFHSAGRKLHGNDEENGDVAPTPIPPRLRREPPPGPLDIAAEDLPF
jgi:ATP-dependent DNA helicase DinG